MMVIPDVHGRTFWRKAVKDYLGKEPILFLGYYSALERLRSSRHFG